MAERKLELHFVDAIEVHGRLRAIKESSVETMASSLSSIGLRTPISVRYYDERPDHMPPGETSDALVLLTGATRLAAAKSLGWEMIECFVYYDGDEIDARLWEIAENLHRAELTALERDEQVALWVRLNAEKVLAQTAPKPLGGRPEGGVRAAARELGIDRDDARRAVKVASLSDEAKEAAREAGLDDNRTALLDAAKQTTPEEQVKAITERQQRLARQAEHDRVRDEVRDNLPPEIKAMEEAKAAAIESKRDEPSREAPLPDGGMGGLMAAERIAELETILAQQDATVTRLERELEKFEGMKVLFDKGGFEAVVSAKDDEIHTLQTRVSAESRDKALWMRKANYWKEQAQKLGWQPTATDQPAPLGDDDAFYDVVEGRG